MARYRKKPVEIEAWQWKGALQSQPAASLEGAPEWIHGAYAADNLYFFKGRLMIRTLEGVMEASRNDFIIQGVRGELYPCKPDIFRQTYDKVG